MSAPMSTPFWYTEIPPGCTTTLTGRPPCTFTIPDTQLSNRITRCDDVMFAPAMEVLPYDTA